METIQECKNISEIKEKLSTSILLDEIKETCMRENPLDYAIQNRKNLAANYYIESKLLEITQKTVDNCMKCNNTEILAVLHEKFPPFFTQENLDNFLLWCVADPRMEQMAEFLIKKGADVNSRQSLPLWSAVDSKNLFFTKFLLKHGAKINESIAKKSIQKDSFSLPVFELLMKHDMNITFDNFYLLRCAAGNNIDSALKLILEKMKMKDFLKDQTRCLYDLLNLTAYNKFTECAILLMQYGVIPDEYMLTVAERNRGLKLAQFIREKGVRHSMCSIM